MKCRSPRDMLAEEMKRQAEEWHIKYNEDLYATILWTLHTEFNFGQERLVKAFNALDRNIKEMSERYEFTDAWQERRLLKEKCQVDISELFKNSCFLK